LHSANVTLNGKKLTVLPGPGFSYILDKKQFKANNFLVIEVSNLMANRIPWMDKNGIPWKKFTILICQPVLKKTTGTGYSMLRPGKLLNQAFWVR